MFFGDVGLVAVTINHGGETGSLGIDVQIRQNVAHIDAVRTERDYLGYRKRLSPAAMIHIAADREHGRDRAQFAQNVSTADVARMDDQIGALQRFDRGRA